MKELEITCIQCGIVDNEEGFWDYNEEDKIGVCHVCGSEMVGLMNDSDNRNIAWQQSLYVYRRS